MAEMTDDWSGLGYDGEPIVRQYYKDEKPASLYTKRSEYQRARDEGRLTPMDLLWKGLKGREHEH